jgi:lipoprotein-anchoring transpeptidase ErfK/SrfK
MRKASRSLSLATAGLTALGCATISGQGLASAAQDIVVIPGIGPNDLPAPTQPPPRVLPPAQPAAPATRGAYGGGFLEFVITGNSGAPRPYAYGGAPAVPSPAPANTHSYVATLGSPAADVEPAAPPEEFRRQEVSYDGRERPGTIIIDTPNKFLFLVQPGGRAVRYGIGVGRPGFEWSGVKTISRKAEWPGWTPPEQMMLRRPDLPSHMDGGPGNPLGARALYLGSSLYRIHGTNEPWTIGRNVSSGCIRMMNDDVIDLYNRVPVGTRVIVI